MNLQLASENHDLLLQLVCLQAGGLQRSWTQMETTSFIDGSLLSFSILRSPPTFSLSFSQPTPMHLNLIGLGLFHCLYLHRLHLARSISTMKPSSAAQTKINDIVRRLL
uniref:Uncharacterized protein n=1 Tax=Cannabis sativa TaxID=3483 RepID=A0A803PRH8_CANSA